MISPNLSSWLDLSPNVWRGIIAFLALLISYTVARFSIRNKQVDFLLYDHKQFDELQKKRTELLVEQDNRKYGREDQWSETRFLIEVDMFFDRFWSLQFDSFVGWWEGYMPTSLYKFWLFSRWRELSHSSPGWTFAEDRTMRSSLISLNQRWSVNPDPRSSQTMQLSNFMDLMFELSENKRRVDIDALLIKYGPPRAIRTLRKFFGAY